MYFISCEVSTHHVIKQDENSRNKFGKQFPKYDNTQITEYVHSVFLMNLFPTNNAT